MERRNRRAGLALTLTGAAGIGFFWITDPRCGWFLRTAGSGEGWVDQLHGAVIGTAVGIAGSALVCLIGLFLMTRRSI